RTQGDASAVAHWHSERPDAPETVGVHLKSHLKGLEHAGVRAPHLEDRLETSSANEPDIGEDRIDRGQVGGERRERLLISAARTFSDLGEGLRDVTAAQ